jgi:hypothetical protein
LAYLLKMPNVVLNLKQKTKKILFVLIDNCLINNTIKYENSLLIYEFETFSEIYSKLERNNNVLNQISKIQNQIFVLRSKKFLRTSTFDNSALLSKYDLLREKLLDQEIETLNKKIKIEEIPTPNLTNV